MPVTPKLQVRRSSKTAWSIMSNAALRSRDTSKVSLPSSNVEKIRSMRSCKLIATENEFLYTVLFLAGIRENKDIYLSNIASIATAETHRLSYKTPQTGLDASLFEMLYILILKTHYGG